MNDARGRLASGQPADPQGEAQGEQEAKSTDAPSFVEHLLRPREPRSGLGEAEVLSWSDTAGVLDDGAVARQSVSCLVRPCPGDRVLAWSDDTGTAWVLAVLQRPDEAAGAVLSAPGGMTLEAPRIALSANAVQIAAQDFLTNVHNRHAVENTRTEHSKVRVSQVGTDIRRATTADDMVEGTFVQRTGTWLSNTVRDARLRARSFLFD